MERQETYLGDGVYASFDGWYVWLAVERDGKKERVALEPEVFDALLGYVQRAWRVGDASWMDALSALRAKRREAFARDASPCALEQGVRYGNCPACVLDGFLDPADCLDRGAS